MISKILNSNIPKFLQGLILLRPMHETLFNKIELEKLESKYNLSEVPLDEKINAYQGYDCCGEAVFVTKQILGNYGVDTKVFINNTNIRLIIDEDEFIINHVVLNKDDLIIDPSIRQLLIDNRSDEYLNCRYRKYLFSEIDPFFIGVKKEYEKILEDANYLNEKVFGKPNVNLKRIKEFCTFNKDITNKFTMERFLLKNYELENYHKIIKLLNKN